MSEDANPAMRYLILKGGREKGHGCMLGICLVPSNKAYEHNKIVVRPQNAAHPDAVLFAVPDPVVLGRLRWKITNN